MDKQSVTVCIVLMHSIMCAVAVECMYATGYYQVHA